MLTQILTLLILYIYQIDFNSDSKQYTLRSFGALLPKKTVFGAEAVAAPPDPIEQLKSESHHIIKNHETTDSSLPVHQITTIKLSIQKTGANYN